MSNSNNQKILFAEIPGNKPLPPGGILTIVGGDSQVTSVTSQQAAITALNANQEAYDIIICNAPDPIVFNHAKSAHPKITTILVTDNTMDVYSKALNGEEDKLVDQLIANRTPNDWTINELRVSVQKILRKDIFGIEKYLLPHTSTISMAVKGSADREICNESVMRFAERNSLGQYIAKLVFGITEELLMNAIYDAPTSKGRHQYSEVSRTTIIELKPDEYSELTCGCDGTTFAISVRDPFGALKREKLFQYIKKVLLRRDSANLVDTKKGGAGLGLFKILYSSHSLVCNVESDKRTEVMALIDINHQIRDFSKTVRSIGFFEI